jgi:superfamily II DNA or RNA helicase
LALATGTGKTKTAIAAIRNFQQKFPQGTVVVTAPYQALASQWIDQLRNLGVNSIKVFGSHLDWESRVQNIVDSIQTAIDPYARIPVLVCVNKTFRGENFQAILTAFGRDSFQGMIVVDECHHFNSRPGINALPSCFNFRMGLSATPFEGGEKRFLDEYFSGIAFEYSLASAIKNGHLAQYNYNPILIELTEHEADEYVHLIRLVQKRFATAKDELESDEYGQPEIEIDGLLENLTAKLTKLSELLKASGRQKFSLFYCGVGSIKLPSGERMRQIHFVTKLLDQLSWKISKITAEETAAERERILDSFRNEQIEAIASMKVLDEGIDVPDCRNAYILASQRSERQGIQRRGRVLRIAPGKSVANLYDFIIVGPRMSIRELEDLYSKELKRAIMFSGDAVNKSECLKILQQYL